MGSRACIAARRTSWCQAASTRALWPQLPPARPFPHLAAAVALREVASIVLEARQRGVLVAVAQYDLFWGMGWETVTVAAAAHVQGPAAVVG